MTHFIISLEIRMCTPKNVSETLITSVARMELGSLLSCQNFNVCGRRASFKPFTHSKSLGYLRFSFCYFSKSRKYLVYFFNEYSFNAFFLKQPQNQEGQDFRMNIFDSKCQNVNVVQTLSSQAVFEMFKVASKKRRLKCNGESTFLHPMKRLLIVLLA